MTGVSGLDTKTRRCCPHFCPACSLKSYPRLRPVGYPTCVFLHPVYLVLTSILIPLSTLHVLNICPNLLIHSCMSPTESQAKIPRHHLIPLFLLKKTSTHEKQATTHVPSSLQIPPSPHQEENRRFLHFHFQFQFQFISSSTSSLYLSLPAVHLSPCYPFIRLVRIVRCRTYIIYLTRSSQFNSKDEKIPVAVTYEKATVCLQVYCI